MTNHYAILRRERTDDIARTVIQQMTAKEDGNDVAEA